MRAARDEGDVLTASRQLRAEIAADGARTDNRKSHRVTESRNLQGRQAGTPDRRCPGLPFSCRSRPESAHIAFDRIRSMAARLTAYLVAFIVGTTVHRRAHRRRAARRCRPGRSDRASTAVSIRPTATATMAEAVAVQGNKILHVGTNREVQRLAAAADRGRRRQGRRGAARVQRRARAPAERRPVAEPDQPARREDAARDRECRARLGGGASRRAVGSWPRLVCTNRFRAACRRGRFSTRWSRIGRRI